MKILIIGASGFLGTKLMKSLKKDFEVFGTCFDKKIKALHHLDITHEREVNDLFQEIEPQVVIHVGGITNVDACEQERKKTWKVNVLSTKNIINACLKHNSKLVYFSTDYVFDGKKGDYSETDKPNPISYYAETKVESEKMVLKHKNNLVLRTAVLYGYNNKQDKMHFMKLVCTKLNNGQKVNAFVDWIRTPTLIDDIAHALTILIRKNKAGIYHVVGSETISMHDFALKISETFNLDKSLVKKASMKDFEKMAGRPFDSSLNISKIKNLGVEMSGIHAGLELTKKQMEADKE